MNNFKKFLILNIILMLPSCSTIKEGFANQKKNSSDEFLVEKKSPLIMPPRFEELPIPSNKKSDKKNQINNIELLITENNNVKLETGETDKDFEQSILNKIKNN